MRFCRFCLLVSYAASGLLKKTSLARLHHTKGCDREAVSPDLLRRRSLRRAPACARRTPSPSPTRIAASGAGQTGTNHHAPLVAAPPARRRARARHAARERGRSSGGSASAGADARARRVQEQRPRPTRARLGADLQARLREVQRQRHGPERHAAARAGDGELGEPVRQSIRASRRFIAATIRLMHRSELQLRRAPSATARAPHGLEGRVVGAPTSGTSRSSVAPRPR